jgi:hypothetical protein
VLTGPGFRRCTPPLDVEISDNPSRANILAKLFVCLSFIFLNRDHSPISLSGLLTQIYIDAASDISKKPKNSDLSGMAGTLHSPSTRDLRADKCPL